ncbi:hypothetical protein [Chitinophaga sp. 22620]|uniref:hypothetical protein n=1 Tax=Chitinophaga sp. 22620 TaxID=3453952 RepID=UPI003F87C0FC
MLSYISDIFCKSRLRILSLLILSLVACAPDILPADARLGGFQELLLETESAEACKVSLGMETSVRNKRTSAKQLSASACGAIPHGPRRLFYTAACWIRPAYYTFLHRFSLF